MTIGQLHAAKRAALKDYVKAKATNSVAKAAYEAAADAYMEGIAPYQATMAGYLEPAGLSASSPHAGLMHQDGIPAYRIVNRHLESDIYLLPDNMRNVEVGIWVEKGDYLVKTGPNAD